MKNKILIIEDELSIGEILSYAFRKEGFEVRHCLEGQEGLEIIKTFQPEIILLDLMLPDISGFELCKIITTSYKLPILMLTARNDVVDKILGLELGADDYITKPFDIREVIARVKATLRRIELTNSQLAMDNENSFVQINPWVKINKNSRSVYKNNEEIRLKPKEYDLLLLFCENKNLVLSREQLLDRVWSVDFEGDLRTVDVHVTRLRKKLDIQDKPSIIETIFGIGYKMR